MPGSILRACAHCGAAFHTIPAQIARGRGVFCGRACYLASRTGPTEDRFWSQVDKNGPLILDTPCWLWVGSRYSNGYGRFWVEGEQRLTHRFAWELSGQELPAELYVLHRCDTPACVRASHLFLGTAKDNSLDMVQKGRHSKLCGEDHPGFGVQKTHCAKGHPLTDDNVIVTGTARRCLICYRASSRARALRYAESHRAEINEAKKRRRDATRTGPATGERHGQSKLTGPQVVAIRDRYAAGGVTHLTLAEEFGVTPSLISQIIRRLTWRHVP